MTLAICGSEHVPLLRHSRWDALLVGLALLHGVVVLAWPAAALVAVGLWWNANTISHNFIHRPFFTRSWMNRLFSMYESVLLGLPQTLWRARHLAHHAGVPSRLRWSRQLMMESSLVAGLWAGMAAAAPLFFLTVYLPGFAGGLVLCWLQGHYEHVRGTVSHYGRIYNLLFLNDGYHVEHHDNAAVHWTQLPMHRQSSAASSRWPAVLRWIEQLPAQPSLKSRRPHARLCFLERCLLRCPMLQRFVLDRHERAFRRLLAGHGELGRVGIIGGGLFPRTVLVLKRIFPRARLTVIDADAEHIDVARRIAGDGVEFIHAWHDPRRHDGFDMIVIPLAFVGDRERIYEQPPAPIVLVHDWIWRRRGMGTIVSLPLLKRLNLVRP